MSCDLGPLDVYQCGFCNCQFEEGVAGTNAAGEPRCPDCGACMAKPVPDEQVGPFVIMRWNGFG